MLETDDPIVVEQFFKASKEELWSAITELSQMTNWFFENIEQFKSKVGFKTRFTVENEGRLFPHIWEIEDVELYSRIAYNWKYEGYDGDSKVTFDLKEEAKGVTLKLTHKVIKSFSQDIREFSRESCENGWIYFIKSRLVKYLENK